MSNIQEKYIIEHHAKSDKSHRKNPYKKGSNGSWEDDDENDYNINEICGSGYIYDPNNIDSDQYGCIKNISENLEFSKKTNKKNRNYILILYLLIFLFVLIFIISNF